MVGNFEHILVLAAMWGGDDNYVAVYSTPSQWLLALWTKTAPNLCEAVWGKAKWKNTGTYVAWPKVLYWLYWDPDAWEAQIFTNDNEGEIGVTIFYRYLNNFRRWTMARVSIPEIPKALWNASQIG